MKKNITNLSKQFRKFLSKDKTFLLFIAITIVLFIVNLFYIHIKAKYILNPDGVSYLTIADLYAHGNIKEAVNGYWGPLLSLFIVPSSWLHINPISWFFMLNTGFAIATSALLYLYLFRTLHVGKKVVFTLCLAVMLTLYSYSISVITPDILFTFILLCVFIALQYFLTTQRTYAAVLLAGSGALLYYAKSIGLPLFIVLLVALALYAYKKRAGAGMKRTVMVLVIYLVLILPFIAAISLKYHTLTYSTSGQYNMNLVGPEQKKIHPISIPGIHAPQPGQPHVWVDPSFLPMHSWSPLNDPLYLVGNILNNLTDIWTYSSNLGPLFFAGLACIATFVITKQRDYRLVIWSAALMILTMWIGYALVLVEERYLWCTIPLFTIALAVLVKSEFSGLRLRKSMSQYILYPVIPIVILVSSIFGTIATLSSDSSMKLYKEEVSIRQYISPGDRIVSDDKNGMFTCYYLHLQCYGILSSRTSSSTIDKLRKDGIPYMYFTKKINESKYHDLLDKYYTHVGGRLYKLK